MTTSALSVAFAYSADLNPEGAVLALRQQLSGPEPKVVFFFCSTSYDLPALAKDLETAFPCPVIGCTTAGELSVPGGYSKDSIIAVALSSERLKIKPYLISNLRDFSLSEGKKLKKQIAHDFSQNAPTGFRRFGMMLIDGMSSCEEQVAAALSASLSPLPVIGGSAGDNLNFTQTYVYYNGEFMADAAVLAVVETAHIFRLFQTKHFQPTGQKLVITEAKPEERLVTEINGFPAAGEYARLIGVERNQLSDDVFSLYPVMLKIGGEYHVRSIQRLNEDESLTFYCAIDTGLVMTIGNGRDIFEETRESLEKVALEVGQPLLTLGCDCVLRRLEVESQQLQDTMSKLLAEYKFFGFSTYGEQYGGIHINQTLTGIMIGE